MLQFLENNWGTLVVAAVLILVVLLVVRVMIRDRKAGKTACGNNCAGCALAGKCHVRSEVKGRPIK